MGPAHYAMDEQLRPAMIVAWASSQGWAGLAGLLGQSPSRLRSPNGGACIQTALMKGG